MAVVGLGEWKATARTMAGFGAGGARKTYGFSYTDGLLGRCESDCDLIPHTTEGLR